MPATSKLFHDLQEAARQIVYFGGATPDNLRALRDRLDACDIDDRSRGYDPADEDQDEDIALEEGDRVRWNDPDGGLCSRELTITTVEQHDGLVSIVADDGSVLDCPAHELEIL